MLLIKYVSTCSTMSKIYGVTGARYLYIRYDIYRQERRRASDGITRLLASVVLVQQYQGEG